MLTQNQLQSIIQTLKASGIKYQEVYEELLDHYAAAIEEKIKHGQAFDEALEEVHQDFGGQKGVKYIQERYYKQIWNHYRLMQWQHFKELFQWPQLLSSLVIGILIYGLASLLRETNIIIGAIIVIAIIPLLLASYEYIRILRKSNYSKKSAKGDLLMHLSSLGLLQLNLFMILPKVFFNDLLEREHGINFYALYPAAMAVLLTLYTFYLLSFLKSLQHARTSIV